ncbi:hypothetical protein EYR41_006953 [Orbilia oligospora]|uniref:Uncharacterized protein n=1 Tax=Orbilia oligospora TaxID=2813651 RepID=A0A8H2E1Q3_ORBOL|nr:hypothetical protein TWF132_004959 [Orbilia oligospora]TGJ67854.1 hypothetical protein EYR41_006953 [Orbilia oligospora]
MHIPLSTLLLLPLTSALVVTDPGKLFARKKNGWCDIRGIDRYINNLPKSASSSVKSWCSAQTVINNGTFNYFATVTVTDDNGGTRVTKTRTTKTKTKTWTRYRRTKTVTVKRRTTKTSASTTSTTPALAARQITTTIFFDESAIIGGDLIKRSDHNNNINDNYNDGNENQNFPVLDYSNKGINSLRSGTPRNWTNLPDRLIQVLCGCLDSPWKTKNGTWTKTGHHTRTKTWTKTGVKTRGGTTTVDVDGTTTKTVDSSGEATVTAIAE